MIRSYFGLTDDPFGMRQIELLPHQQEIHETLKVHCQQGGFVSRGWQSWHRQNGY